MRQAAALRAFEAMPGVRQTQPTQSTNGVQSGRTVQDTAQLQGVSQTSAARARVVSKLVAATVPGKVDFTNSASPTQTTSIPLYKHPADKNAAATGVFSGRAIDVEA